MFGFASFPPHFVKYFVIVGVRNKVTLNNRKEETQLESTGNIKDNYRNRVNWNYIHRGQT
jgi:hypothetical protein